MQISGLMSHETKIDKLDFTKITNFCSVNENEKTNQKLGENTCKDAR